MQKERFKDTVANKFGSRNTLEGTVSVSVNLENLLSCMDIQEIKLHEIPGGLVVAYLHGSSSKPWRISIVC